jgi:hypothetical protein
MDDDDEAPSAAAVGAAATMNSRTDRNSSKPRGPGYTSIEDLIVARSFIAASEDAISGNRQKGKVFKQRMYDMYTELAKDHITSDKELLMQSSHATREEYIKNGVGKLFPLRSVDSIYNRFKGQISAEVMKYMGVVETTKMCGMLMTIKQHAWSSLRKGMDTRLSSFLVMNI